MTTFHQNIISIYGEAGQQWLDQLPILVAEIAESWGLSDLIPMENLSYNYVLSGFHNDKPIILKTGLDIEGLNREASALRAFEEHGAVEVLKLRKGVILLERAMPGTSLKRYFPEREEESISITCDLIQKLHRAHFPTTGHFPHIRDWLGAIDQHVENYVRDEADPVFMETLLKARDFKNYLLESSPQDIFLHGDLHHDNILSHGDSFVAIDPKGVIGDPAYEVAAFIRNPIPNLLESPNALSIITTRIHDFAIRLNMDSQRITQWCYVEAVLSWIWNIEDGLYPDYFRNLTILFESMLRDFKDNDPCNY